MRRSLLLACLSVALAAAAACASSGEENSRSPEPRPETSAVVSDAQTSGEASVDAAVDAPICSPAGWCVTALPDTDLILKDVWPVTGGASGSSAFAIAESPTLGIKVLAWSDADPRATWQYIDDGTQNEPGFGHYAGRIWAPNGDEVYFGVGPGGIYHGVRPVPPATTWSWTRSQLEDHSPDQSSDHPGYEHGNPSLNSLGNYPALGVWGTSRDDVYAWYANTIYRRQPGVGGALEWVAEYTADTADTDDPREHLFIFGAAGSDPGDIWFSGAKDRQWWGSCAVVVRKTAGEYRRIADGTLPDFGTCSERPGFLRIVENGWLTDIQSSSGTGMVGLVAPQDVVRIAVEGDGYKIDRSHVPMPSWMPALNSLWSGPSGEVWVSGRSSIVMRGDEVWDGGAYQVSSITLNGGPLETPAFQIRGTSNDNLWRVGQHALHKTTF
jgi:hypothetical protein